MAEKAGTISFNGEAKAQVQIMDSADGKRRVQLYNTDGVFLCECDFEGDDEAGFAIGRGLFTGYMAGWDNCTFSISRAVTKALYEKHEIGIK